MIISEPVYVCNRLIEAGKNNTKFKLTRRGANAIINILTKQRARRPFDGRMEKHMRGNRILRVVLGIILIIIFGIYMYLDLSQRPTSEDYDKGLVQQQEQPPVQTEAPAEEPVEQPSSDESEPAESETEPEEIVSEPENALPDVDITSWELMLVNASNNIADYAPETEKLEGQEFDKRIIQPMKDFVAAARAEGLNVYLSSGYRDYNTQSYLYNRKIGQGYSAEDAARIVAPPGTSEHQTGLACDITDRYYELKDSSLENTATYIWMSEHCHEYGFIVRYPKDKSGLTTADAADSVTGIIYEPWHFRYVGVEAATYIMENGLCLEEFIELYK